MTSLTQLPAELADNVFSFTRKRDLLALRRSCRGLHQVIEHDRVMWALHDAIDDTGKTRRLQWVERVQVLPPTLRHAALDAPARARLDLCSAATERAAAATKAVEEEVTAERLSEASRTAAALGLAISDEHFYLSHCIHQAAAFERATGQFSPLLPHPFYTRISESHHNLFFRAVRHAERAGVHELAMRFYLRASYWHAPYRSSWIEGAGRYARTQADFALLARAWQEFIVEQGSDWPQDVMRSYVKKALDALEQAHQSARESIGASLLQILEGVKKFPPATALFAVVDFFNHHKLELPRETVANICKQHVPLAIRKGRWDWRDRQEAALDVVLICRSANPNLATDAVEHLLSANLQAMVCNSEREALRARSALAMANKCAASLGRDLASSHCDTLIAVGRQWLEPQHYRFGRDDYREFDEQFGVASDIAAQVGWEPLRNSVRDLLVALMGRPQVIYAQPGMFPRKFITTCMQTAGVWISPEAKATMVERFVADIEAMFPCNFQSK